MIREYIVKISDEIMEEEIADRPQELVRCKDCKHRETIYCPFYQKYKGTKYDDWFCADGKRRE